MEQQDWQKIKEVFNEAVELSSADREKLLHRKFNGNEEMRREVKKMLAFADEETSTDTLEKNAFEIFSNGNHTKIPEQIGDYKIESEIGCGGMGAVYKAVRENENFTQRAALKIIKRGMDTDAIVSRFRHEQKILASLEHPNIARFLDGGMTDEGLPFYAMEFVEGEFIDDYCKEKNLNIKEKLELFREVCAAVQYAHQNLVIHRDLKPRNILVTKDGTPKLLDFGIGKILTSETEEIGTATQFGMMTPAYASPEQIRGERIGTTSDIYSLGVILFELLTGEKPYKINSKSQIEIERAILETEPNKPSAVQSSKRKVQNLESLDKDVDNIILKALRKNPNERYSSVQEFAEDIRRHLVGLPVSARPLTYGYRAAKFYQRNKVSVIAGAFVFLALFTGIIVALWQAQIAGTERARAEHRFNKVRQLANNVIFKYHDAIAALPGATATREMLVSDALQYLDNLSSEAEGNTELQRELAAAYLKLGDVQGKQYEANLGDTEGAVQSYQKAVALLESVVRNDKENLPAKFELVRAYDALFAVYMRFADENTKLAVLEKALNLQNELINIEPENFEFQMQKINLLVRKGDVVRGFENKFQDFLQTIELAERLYQKHPTSRALKEILMKVYQRAGSAKIWQGDQAKTNNQSAENFYLEALPFHKKSLEFAEAVYLADEQNLPNRRRYATTLINLAETSAKNGSLDEKNFEKARRLFQKTTDEDPRNLEAVFDLAETNRTESEIKLQFGEKREAIKYLEKALELFQKMWKADGKNNEIVKAMSETHEKLAELYETENQPQKVLFHRREMEKIRQTSNQNSPKS
ncbi:hypothetical protein BH20ACI4_BH20ACI4_26180 [soil metagenome]